MVTTQHGNAFAEPLLTQPQAWDEASTKTPDFASPGKKFSDPEVSGKTAADADADADADGSSIFEVIEECDDNAGPDEALLFGDGLDPLTQSNDLFKDDALLFGDGFNLLTQSNDLFKDDALDDGESSSDGSSDESGGEDSDSSCEEEEEETIQVRRERNILRNETFINIMKLQLDAMGGNQHVKKKRKVMTEKEARDDPGRDVDVEKEVIQRKKRGMIFVNPTSNGHQKSSAEPTAADPPPLTTKSLVDELNPNYPHRSKQIRILCSQLVTIVQKSNFAWRMSDNIRSSGNTQYSEASYQGDTKLAASSPIVITGAAGVGKTCIVRDAMGALQRRTNGVSGAVTMHPTLAHAYVDCASSESGSVAAVMNSAYRQLYECCQPTSTTFGRHGNVEVKGKTKFGDTGKLVLGGDDFGGTDFEGETEDERADEEDLIERQRRKRRQGKSSRSKKNKAGKAATFKARRHKDNLGKNIRQTRLQTTLASKAASEPAVEKSAGLKGSIQGNVNKNSQNSGSVALFGRATSALVQGNATKKKMPGNCRCAFLVLDNADRILSWKKHGATNSLTQIFLLPSVMGINLTLIFISRSTIFQYSPVHNAPASLVDAAHPLKIHFDAYTSVDMIKTILHVPRVKLSIIGRSSATSQMFSSSTANVLRSKLNEVLYASMMNSFAAAVKSSTLDITEIMRLARQLWLEYVAPLDRTNGRDDPSLKALVWQVLLCLRRDTGSLNDPDCSLCQCLSSGTDGDVSVMDLNTLKQRLSEKLDRNMRDALRRILTSTVMMPGRVLHKQNIEPYARRLPYTTKFLLIAAFLCQSKRPEQDVNLFTTKNTGKSKRGHVKKSGDELAYASSSKELKQRQPSFPLERLFSVFYSIIAQYGQHFMHYKEKGAPIVSQLGTERLFQNISQLITSGMLSSIGSVKFDEKYNHDLLDMTSAKFSCTISRDDACVIASSVGFPIEKYCP